MSFAASVWRALSAIDCSAKIEKKQSMSYLSWAWAWGILMDFYPESDYQFHDDKVFDDGTVEVGVTITVREGESALARYMWLPVMDHRNASIVNPTSRQRSDARMRCLVKCIAMFGLGHFIYAGEDLPDADKDKAEKPGYTQEQRNLFLSMLSNDDALGFIAFMSSLDEQTQNALHNSFEKGKVSSGKAAVHDLDARGRSVWEDVLISVTEMIEAEDGFGLLGETVDMKKYEKAYLARRLGKDKCDKMIALINQAKAAA